MPRAKGPILTYRPNKDSRALLTDIHAVLNEARRNGTLPMTVRQVYYRLISMKAEDGSGKAKYPKGKSMDGRVIYAMGNARRAWVSGHELAVDPGLVYEEKTTRSRPPRQFEDLDGFFDFVRRYGSKVQLPRQRGQERFLVGWCEARGLMPLLEPFAHERGVEVIGSGGYDSITTKIKLAYEFFDHKVPVIVLQVGDRDDDGDSIFASLKADIEAWLDYLGGEVEFVRVAVTPAQIAEYELPDDPAKPGSVQAEAIPPATMRNIWRDAIISRQDEQTFQEVLEAEREMRAEIERRSGAA